MNKDTHPASSDGLRVEQRTSGSITEPDMVCFSHLRWDFVYQRPQHLMTRFAQNRRVFYVEEPVLDNASMRLEVRERHAGVQVVVPFLAKGLKSEVATTAVLKEMMDRFFAEQRIRNYVFWYYTPMALTFTAHFKPMASVYDCMDELSAFKDSPSRLPSLEKLLFERVDLVFTGGQSLYEAKRNEHISVHCFPSGLDVAHFKEARTATADPPDQSLIPRPRLGFFGVIDERFDTELLNALARMRPDWHFVMIGPVVKISSESLPNHPNIHYLGLKRYDELPAYLANWDIALLLFARNKSTRYISPTKTPEYLAASKPVISTSIHDVVRCYGEMGLVEIADSPGEFIRAAEKILSKTHEHSEWLTKVDTFLEDLSWDKRWTQMSALINQVVEKWERANSTTA